MSEDEAVRALVERALRAPDPCAALRTITALRREIDELERAQVSKALGSGRSFADVAHALGVSRQAAHRRFRHLGGAAPDPPPAARPPSRVLITSEVRRAVACAREEARGLGAAKVGTEHLLLGILRAGAGPVAALLAELGVQLEAAREKAQPTALQEEVIVEGRPVPAGPEGISPYARGVFEQSLREAVARGDGYIGVDHLLLASLRDREGGACRTLDALGVDPEAVRERLQTGVSRKVDSRVS